VYQTYRFGTMTYTLPNLTPNAAYTVRLHFAESAFSSTGSRLFNVLINGTTVLTDFDIIAVAGAANRAVVEQFNATATSTGQIAVQFVAHVNNPMINAIEIITGS
jgi:hypothetical protein